MIKISANMSKKAPIPGQEFSSRQFGASMELEMADCAETGEIADRLRDVYALVEALIDEQMERVGEFTPRSESRPEAGDNGRPVTPAQLRAISAIIRDYGLSQDQFREMLADYGVESVQELGVRGASELIDALKGVERV